MCFQAKTRAHVVQRKCLGRIKAYFFSIDRAKSLLKVRMQLQLTALKAEKKASFSPRLNFSHQWVYARQKETETWVNSPAANLKFARSEPWDWNYQIPIREADSGISLPRRRGNRFLDLANEIIWFSCSYFPTGSGYAQYYLSYLYRFFDNLIVRYLENYFRFFAKPFRNLIKLSWDKTLVRCLIEGFPNSFLYNW